MKTLISIFILPHIEEDGQPSASCLSLQNSCNKKTVDLKNFYDHIPCILLTACSSRFRNPAQVLSASHAPATQPHLTKHAFNAMSLGNSYMTKQEYINAYYHQISITPGGIYPPDVAELDDQWMDIVAWTGSCATGKIPYEHLDLWLHSSSIRGVCPSVPSCDGNKAASATPCVPQPTTDSGSCAEMAAQCKLWVTGGLFQNKYCVLASFCYAWSNTDVLLQHEYSSLSPLPLTSQQAKLSKAVFHNITGGEALMTQKNVIDAYYAALTGTWNETVGHSGSKEIVRTKDNGPYPTSSHYVIEFWSLISGWTGFCETRAIPYDSLANYLSYAATSSYHPTC
ncbi:hypothetical protein BDR07DRAFT_1441782 [Suillus spraguei]|nr:hypothetical protein BDR07DRAFT_1441782 [Suillus spraguei]